MTVSYNSKKIIPAPFVSISKEYTRAGDGHLIGSNFVISLQGKMVSSKGSPNSSGTFWDQSGYPADDVPAEKHAALLTKYAALKNLFATEGQSLEFQAQDGSLPLRCYPRMRSFNVEEGIWVDYINYNVVFETPELFSANSSEDFSIGNSFFKNPDPSGERYFLQNVNETWNLEETEAADWENPHGYRISHNINAVGREVYGPEGIYCKGWEQARKWVLDRDGSNSDYIYNTSGLAIPLFFGLYNHTKTESIDEYGGSYGINETWTLSSGTVIDDFTVSVNKKLTESLTSVSIEGRLTGLEVRASGITATNKFASANKRYGELYTGYPNNIIYQRAIDYGASGLNNIPLTTVVGKNPVGGTISYNFEYNTRPQNYIAGSLYEEFNIQYGNATDIYGSIPVLGRVAGPVLQDMNTVSEKTITMSCQVVMPPYSGISPATLVGMNTMLSECPRVGVSGIMQALYNSMAVSYDEIYKREDSEQWNPLTGNYQRTIQYVYQ